MSVIDSGTPRRIGAVLLRHWYLIAGSWPRFVDLCYWPIVQMILWGFITRYLNSVSGAGMDFVPTLLGAVLLWDFFSRVMQGVTTTFLEDVWSRNFLNIFATPLSVSEYLGGLVLSSILTSLVGLVVMLVLATPQGPIITSLDKVLDTQTPQEPTTTS